MDLRPGYKQTEIGPIPADWDAVPLGDLFTFKNGLNKAKKYFGYGTPIVNYMDVFRHPGLRLDRIEGRVDVSKSELEAFEVRKGDVFFTRTSETVEEIGVAAAMLDPVKDTVFSGFVLRARPMDDKLVDLFKAYCFSPRYFRRQVIARATYTTRALTNGRSLSNAVIALPPKREQAAIAEVLADFDSGIAAQCALVSKKKVLRSTAIERLISGKTRILGFTGEWEETALTPVLRHHAGNSGLIKGKLAHAPYHGMFPAYSASGQDVWHSSFEHEGDAIVVSAVGSRCGKAFVAEGKWSAIANTHVVWPDPNRVSIGYLMLLLNDESFWQKSGTGQPFVLFKQTFHRPISLPPIDEQVAIAQAVADLDAEITALEARIEKTRTLKQGMMQTLLTGRVRLPVQGEALDALEVAHA